MKHIRLCVGGEGGCFFSDLKVLEDGETFISIAVLVLNLENRMDFVSEEGERKKVGTSQTCLQTQN